MPLEVWIVIGVVALILGPTQLPKLARSLGSAKRELQEGLDEAKSSPPSAKPAEPKSPEQD